MSNDHKIVLLKCKDYDSKLVHNKVKEAISLIFGSNQVFKKVKKILLKPNLLAPSLPKKPTTDLVEIDAIVLQINGLNPKEFIPTIKGISIMAW